MKTLTYSILLMLFIFTTSCKNDTEKKEDSSKEIKTEAPQFVIKPSATSLEWTAYKTTAKTPVKGVFTNLKFNNKSSESVNNTLNGLEFSIPVSSIFSKDSIRDGKLKQIFFAAMDNTALLKGTLHVKQDSLYADLTMNNVTKRLPLKLNVKDERRISINGTVDLKIWNAEKAVNALHKACFDLHKGADGVSKTWDVVDISISSYLSK